MGLHITIGYDGHGSAARAVPVYCGRSGADARAAEAASNAARFERFTNATGVRKNNPAHDPTKPCFPGAAPVEGTSSPTVSTESAEKEAVDSALAESPPDPDPVAAPAPLTGKKKHS